MAANVLKAENVNEAIGWRNGGEQWWRQAASA
jgi:hypothetical protein